MPVTDMNIVVQKYGGSSLATIPRIKNVASRIIEKKLAGYSPVVVVSAMGSTTDQLVRMAYSVTDSPTKREMDMLLATGEQVSIAMLSMALNDMGHKAISFTGQQVGIHTIGYHGKSRIMDIETHKIEHALSDNNIVIVAGFQGVNEKDDITTLGRGGSDTSAVALSCVLQCPCEIYTDVDGIYGVDPKLYPPAKKLDHVTFDEMLEMASLGSGIMHGRSIELGSKYNAKLYVSSSIIKTQVTYIDHKEETLKISQRKEITGLAVDAAEVLVSLSRLPDQHDIVSDLFARLANQNVNIDMISQTSPTDGLTDISFSAPKDELQVVETMFRVLKETHPSMDYTIDEDVVKLSVVGVGMRFQPGVALGLFDVLQHNHIPVKMITTSEIRISCMIPADLKEKAVIAVADHFEL